MNILKDPRFRFHAKCAAIIAGCAALATFLGAIYFRLERYDAIVEVQRGYEADARRLQAVMDQRFIALDAANVETRLVLEEKLGQLAERQIATDERSKAAVAKAPFPIETVMASIVEIVCIDNKDRDVYYTGSGTVIDKAGVILTNQHLLLSDDGTLIRLCGVGFTADLHQPPKIEYIAALEAVHEKSDLAVMRITEHLQQKALPTEFPALNLDASKASSLGLNLGDPIFIGGYPGIGADTFTFTQGVVSGRVGDALIKTSALIDSGTSGGAAFDGDGNYVGVPTAAARGDIGGSLGYLIGADTIEAFLKDYRAGTNLLPALKRK
ncbi:MAG TPA: serine protease [Patescibacteria group bacterium]|nr:serine protease [Patescibacteria group bacterium]